MSERICAYSSGVAKINTLLESLSATGSIGGVVTPRITCVTSAFSVTETSAAFCVERGYWNTWRRFCAPGMSARLRISIARSRAIGLEVTITTRSCSGTSRASI